MKKTKKEGRELDLELEEEEKEKEENCEPTDEELAEVEEEVKAAQEEPLDTSGIPEDTLKLYFADLDRYPRLSREEERDLATRAAAGDARAREKLISSNLRLVLRWAKKYRYNGFGVSYADLIQAGNEGLVLGVDKFDVKMGCRISTYVTWRIDRQLKKELQLHAPFDYTEYAHRQLKKINSKISEIQTEEGRRPTEEELSAKLNIPLKRVKLLLQRQATVSIDQKAAPEDDDRNYGDFVWDPEAQENLEKIEREDQVDYVRSFLPDALDIVCQRLSPRERRIVEYHFGVGGAAEPHSCQKTADDLETTIEKVMELDAFVLRELKRMMDEDSESFAT